MEPLLVGILGIVAFIVLIILGVHIGVALGLVGLFGIAVLTNFQQALTMSVQSLFYKIIMLELITVPLFIIMGYIAAGGGVSGRLYDSLSLWLGKLKSGFGIATVLGCTGFGAVTGSSMVTSTVFAKISAPEMRRHGYDKRLAYGICASAGIIGMMIPPSVLAIVYGALSGVSIGKILIGGIGPGLLLAVIFSAIIIIIGRVRPERIKTIPVTGITWRQRFASIPPIWPIAVVAVVLIGGIFLGVFSLTEAGSVATFAIIVVLIIIERGRRKEIKEVVVPAFKDTATTSAMIFLLMGGATVFSRFLILSGISEMALNFMINLNPSPIVFTLLFSLLYLLLGTVIDSTSMFCITIPVVQPIVTAFGIDPVWFALVAIVASQIGTITPPFGLCVYGAKAVAERDVSLEDVFAGSMPFLLGDVLAIVILIFVPAIVTLLPSLMFTF